MKMKDQLDSPQPMKKPKAKAKKAEVKKKKQAKLKAKKAEKDKKALKKEAPIATKKNKKSAKADKKDDKNKALSGKSLKAEAPDTTTEIPSEIENTVTTSSSVETSVDTAVIAQPVGVADNDESMTQQKTESQAEPNVDSISPAPALTAEPKPTQSPRRRTRATRRKPSVEDIQALADNANRQRASKNLASLTEQEQNIATQDVVKRLLMGEISQGTALRELRVKVLGLRQEAYTELTGVSRKTLSEVENDKGNYTSEIINKMFKPFQLKVSLVPESSEDLKTILNQK